MHDNKSNNYKIAKYKQKLRNSDGHNKKIYAAKLKYYMDLQKGGQPDQPDQPDQPENNYPIGINDEIKIILDDDKINNTNKLKKIQETLNSQHLDLSLRILTNICCEIFSGNYVPSQLISSIVILIRLIIVILSNDIHTANFGNEKNISFSYIFSTPLNTSNFEFVAPLYIQLFLLLAPEDYVLSMNDEIRLNILYKYILNCYEHKSVITELLERIEPINDINKEYYHKLLTFICETDNDVLVNTMKNILYNDTRYSEEDIKKYFFDANIDKYLVSYHGHSHPKFFVVPRGVNIVFLTPSGLRNFSVDPLQKISENEFSLVASCGEKQQRISGFFAPINKIMDNYAKLGLLHVYEKYSIVPDLILDVEKNDHSFRGVIKFEDADIPYTSLSPPIKQHLKRYGLNNNIVYTFNNNNFSKPPKYFPGRLFLSDIAKQAGILYKKTPSETKKIITLVVISCRINKYFEIKEDIDNCLQKNEVNIFENTSLQDIAQFSQLKPDDPTFMPVVSTSMEQRRQNGNFKIDIEKMIYTLKFPNVCKKIKEFYEKCINGVPFLFSDLCEIYRLGYIYTDGFNEQLDIANIETIDKLKKKIPRSEHKNLAIGSTKNFYKYCNIVDLNKI